MLKKYKNIVMSAEKRNIPIEQYTTQMYKIYVTFKNQIKSSIQNNQQLTTEEIANLKKTFTEFNEFWDNAQTTIATPELINNIRLSSISYKPNTSIDPNNVNNW